MSDIGIESLCSEVTQRCKERIDHDPSSKLQPDEISERLALHALRAVAAQLELVDQMDQADKPITLNNEQAENVVEAATVRLLEADNPALETIKMQVAIEAVSVAVEDEIRGTHQSKEEDNHKRILKITSIQKLRQDQNVTKLYKEVFELLLANDTTPASEVDRNVEREIAAALQSAFPKSDIQVYAQSPAQVKRIQIGRLIGIVLGIRLFNRHIHKGGAGISNVPGLLAGEVAALSQALEQEFHALGTESQQYTDVINFEFAVPGSISAPLKRLQDELTNRRQFILYLTELQEDLWEARDLIDNTAQRFSADMNALKKLVGSRQSVPKGQVFPRFGALASLWQALAAERETTGGRRAVFDALAQFRSSFTSSLTQDDVQAARKWQQDNQQQQQQEATTETPSGEGETDSSSQIPVGSAKGEHGSADSDTPVRVTPESEPEFATLAIEYQGYCPWTMVHRSALLLPGNVDLGLIRHRGFYYSFVDEAAMQAFFEFPHKYLQGVHSLVRKQPELIQLLGLQDQFPSLAHRSSVTSSAGIKQATNQDGEAVTTAEKGVGTPVHFIESHIDPDYVWNEWELRRRALKMVELRQKRTHSVQTHLSHFKRDSETQVYLQKPNADGTMPGTSTQTGVDSSTNTKVVRRYFQGLRGAPSTKMKVVELKFHE